MNGQIFWHSLSVEEFFNLCNWHSLPLTSCNWQNHSTGQAEATLDETLNSCWQCLSVQEFFDLWNWHPLPLKSRSLQYADTIECLTLPVREFFQFIPWEGSSKIGLLPVASPFKMTSTRSEEIPVLDLFDLF